MQYKEFIIKFCEFLKEDNLDLKKQNNIFILEYEKYYIITEIQKSDYSNTVYVNIGICVKELIINLQKPKMRDVQFYTRILFNNKSNIEIDNISEKDVEDLSIQTKEYIKENFNSLDCFKEYLLSNESLLNITQLKLKTYLGIN